jgi:hypothetical protein
MSAEQNLVFPNTSFAIIPKGEQHSNRQVEVRKIFDEHPDILSKIGFSLELASFLSRNNFSYLAEGFKWADDTGIEIPLDDLRTLCILEACQVRHDDKSELLHNPEVFVHEVGKTKANLLYLMVFGEKWNTEYVAVPFLHIFKSLLDNVRAYGIDDNKQEGLEQLMCLLKEDFEHMRMTYPVESPSDRPDTPKSLGVVEAIAKEEIKHLVKKYSKKVKR